MIIQIIFYATIVVVVILAIALVFLVSSYQKLLDRYFSLKREAYEGDERSSRRRALLREEKRKIKVELQRVTTAEIEEYQRMLEGVKEEAKEMLESVSEITKEASIEEVRGIGNLIRQKVDQEHAKVVGELENYKKVQIAKIDTQIGEIIQTAVKKVLGRVLTQKEQEKLIIKALEEAYQENVF